MNESSYNIVGNDDFTKKLEKIANKVISNAPDNKPRKYTLSIKIPATRKNPKKLNDDELDNLKFSDYKVHIYFRDSSKKLKKKGRIRCKI